MPTTRIAALATLNWALLTTVLWAQGPQAYPPVTAPAQQPPPQNAEGPLRLPPRGDAEPAQAPHETKPGTDWTNSLIGLAGVVVFGISAIWLLKRLQPAGHAMLPGEVLEPLGRYALNGQHQLHLLRCGTKVILVALHPGGVQTLTEIIDPAEVDRLIALCRPERGSEQTRPFRKLIEQIERRGHGGYPVDAYQVDTYSAALRGGARGGTP